MKTADDKTYMDVKRGQAKKKKKVNRLNLLVVFKIKVKKKGLFTYNIIRVRLNKKKNAEKDKKFHSSFYSKYLQTL